MSAKAGERLAFMPLSGKIMSSSEMTDYHPSYMITSMFLSCLTITTCYSPAGRGDFMLKTEVKISGRYLFKLYHSEAHLNATLWSSVYATNSRVFICCKAQFYVQPVAKLDELGFHFLKGQSNEIFYFCFSIKRLILFPTHMPRSDIEFRRVFVDLFVLGIPKNRLPLMITKRYIINTLNVE
jgi:hypothetical protein